MIMLIQRREPIWKHTIGVSYTSCLIHQDYFSFRLSLVPINDPWATCERSTSLHEDTINRVYLRISSKDETFFRRSIRKLPEKWGNAEASDRQYFDNAPFFHNKCPIFR
ncbi:hypothetical protein TNCV_2781251 [Trichonephila clavipes]|nr:hypothetical protein TNCV_2781251 [Trichonephila clavipes]